MLVATVPWVLRGRGRRRIVDDDIHEYVAELLDRLRVPERQADRTDPERHPCGNEQSYCSASRGAGRRMSRAKAKRTFTVDDLATQTAGVECRKDKGVLDEIPGAYKDLESVIEAQTDLVEVVARLTTLMCVKG